MEKDLPEISIITIVLDSDTMAPKIDLGTIPPHIAVGIFHKAIEAMDMITPGPTIIYDDEVVYAESFASDEDDLE